MPENAWIITHETLSLVTPKAQTTKNRKTSRNLAFIHSTEKKAKRTVRAVWNPFTKVLELLRCEVSGESVYEFYLDDKTAKIILPNSWSK